MSPTLPPFVVPGGTGARGAVGGAGTGTGAAGAGFAGFPPSGAGGARSTDWRIPARVDVGFQPWAILPRPEKVAAPNGSFGNAPAASGSLKLGLSLHWPDGGGSVTTVEGCDGIDAGVLETGGLEVLTPVFQSPSTFFT